MSDLWEKVLRWSGIVSSVLAEEEKVKEEAETTRRAKEWYYGILDAENQRDKPITPDDLDAWWDNRLLRK